MTHLFDELAKSLGESVPRRESLRRLGAAMAGAVLSPMWLGTAWAGVQDPCKAFCKCSNKKQQTCCLDACRACKGNTGRVGGSCGSHVCCAVAACKGVCSNLRSNPNCGACGIDCRLIGETCCGTYCADLDSDFNNCGRCGNFCAAPGFNEEGACVAGLCVYACVEGTVDCDGECTSVLDDPDNCGACGNYCGGSTPFCYEGTCVENDPCPGGLMCSGICTDVMWDSRNCGGCGTVCPPQFACAWGVCEGITYGYGY
jgi:hypothetical protein